MKKLSALLSIIFVLVLLASCGPSDNPPDDSTPSPKAHDGVFTNEKFGSLTFNGDGKSVTLNVTNDFSELTDIPEGTTRASYAFLFHNEQYRYDKAEYFQIHCYGSNYRLTNNTPETTDDTISLTIGSSNREKAVFKKESSD